MFNEYKQIIKLFEKYIKLSNEFIEIITFINKEDNRFFDEIDKKMSIRGTEYLRNQFNNDYDFGKFLQRLFEEITKDLPYEINYKLKYQRQIYLDNKLKSLVKQIVTHKIFKEFEDDIRFMIPTLPSNDILLSGLLIENKKAKKILNYLNEWKDVVY
jgi:hypothetical protein